MRKSLSSRGELIDSVQLVSVPSECNDNGDDCNGIQTLFALVGSIAVGMPPPLIFIGLRIRASASAGDCTHKRARDTWTGLQHRIITSLPSLLLLCNVYKNMGKWVSFKSCNCKLSVNSIHQLLLLLLMFSQVVQMFLVSTFECLDPPL